MRGEPHVGFVGAFLPGSTPPCGGMVFLICFLFPPACRLPWLRRSEDRTGGNEFYQSVATCLLLPSHDFYQMPHKLHQKRHTSSHRVSHLYRTEAQACRLFAANIFSHAAHMCHLCRHMVAERTTW